MLGSCISLLAHRELEQLRKLPSDVGGCLAFASIDFKVTLTLVDANDLPFVDITPWGNE